ncbi:MAG: hypothetical protein JWQ08_791, partial [Deinococcus sp.]|nr:hypothetical protein [Deinococcus sp.]
TAAILLLLLFGVVALVLGMLAGDVVHEMLIHRPADPLDSGAAAAVFIGLSLYALGICTCMWGVSTAVTSAWAAPGRF